MFYDFDTSYLSNLQTKFDSATTLQMLVKSIQGPSHANLLTTYIPLTSNEKPESLKLKLAEVADFINSEYIRLGTKPTWNSSWPDPTAFKEIISGLQDAVYSAIDIKIYDVNTWGSGFDETGLLKYITDTLSDGNIDFWDDAPTVPGDPPNKNLIAWSNEEYDKDTERELQKVSDGMDSAGASMGARGFRKSNSRVSSMQAEVLLKYQSEREEKNRKIMQDTLAHSRETMKTSYEIGTEIIHLAMNFTNMYNKFICKSQLQLFELYSERIASEIMKFEGQIKELMYPIDFKLEQAQQQLNVIKNTLKTFTADVEYNKVSNEQVKYYVAAYNDFVDAYNTRVSFVKTQIKNKYTEVETNIQKLELSLKSHNLSLGTSLAGIASTMGAISTAMNSATSSQITFNKV